jgi:hypothetical protein
MAMTAQELLIDALSRLNSIPVPYMVTGSMASNYWGTPRSTHDIDLVIQLDALTVSALVKAFASDFFIQEPVIRSAMVQPPRTFNAIDNRSSFKIDFWLLKLDPFDQAMFARRVCHKYHDVDAWFATAEDVILSKLRWQKDFPSQQQLLDIAGIVNVQSDKLDVDYLRHWAKTLGVDETLERLLSGEIRPKTT